MKYIDLHCDALTCEGVSVVTKERLLAGGCAVQCFAAFLREGEGFARALALCEKFRRLCAREGYAAGETGGEGIGAILTVEGGHAAEGNEKNLARLAACGVRMITLTWNFENEIGFPNFDRGRPQRREIEKGLKPFGRDAVETMLDLGVIADVSHGSDRLVRDVAEICKARGAPFVASHSGSAEIFPHARNLTDDLIRLIADCGGVVGLDFCAAFLSRDESAEGQKSALLAHAEHILKAGGEDVLAIGSDFDGIPENPYLKDPAAVPAFLGELQKKFGERVAEKIACGNASRVLGGM